MVKPPVFKVTLISIPCLFRNHVICSIPSGHNRNERSLGIVPSVLQKFRAYMTMKALGSLPPLPITKGEGGGE
jgi:hypothetical protein